MGVVDFMHAEDSAVLFVSEADLLSGMARVTVLVIRLVTWKILILSYALFYNDFLKNFLNFGQ